MVAEPFRQQVHDLALARRQPGEPLFPFVYIFRAGLIPHRGPRLEFRDGTWRPP